jgi:hypothetical protein
MRKKASANLEMGKDPEQGLLLRVLPGQKHLEETLPKKSTRSNPKARPNPSGFSEIF